MMVVVLAVAVRLQKPVFWSAVNSGSALLMSVLHCFNVRPPRLQFEKKLGKIVSGMKLEWNAVHDRDEWSGQVRRGKWLSRKFYEESQSHLISIFKLDSNAASRLMELFYQLAPDGESEAQLMVASDKTFVKGSVGWWWYTVRLRVFGSSVKLGHMVI